MTVQEYCCKVQELLLDADVCPEQGLLHRVDRARASKAVTLSLEGRDDRALELAEDVAERWMLPV